MRKSMELSMGTIMKLPMQNSIETRYDTVNLKFFRFTGSGYYALWKKESSKFT